MPDPRRQSSFRGTLDLLILKALTLAEMHGLGTPTRT
jgi:hypothetical protein